jgi:hypothetical protein
MANTQLEIQIFLLLLFIFTYVHTYVKSGISRICISGNTDLKLTIKIRTKTVFVNDSNIIQFK